MCRASTSRTGDRLPGIRIPEQHPLFFCLAANSICPAHASQCNNASFQGYQSTMYLHSNAAIHATCVGPATWCNMVSWSAARSNSRTGDRLPGIRIPEQHPLSFCLAANSICPAHQTKQNPKVTQHYSTE